MTYNTELYRELQPFLHLDEQVLWTGKPYTSRSYHTSPFLVIFSLFWCGFAVFWTVMASSAGGFFGLFGIPFVCVGVYLLYSVFFGQKKAIQSAVYAVTDRRALILTHDRNGVNCTEYVFANLANISLEDVQGDTGTIRFVQPMPYYNGYHYGNAYYGRRRGGYDARRELSTAFFMIDGVHEVYRMISAQLGRTA